MNVSVELPSCRRPIVLDRNLRDESDLVANGFPRRENCLAQFVEIAESFEDQQIDTRLGERGELFSKKLAGFGEGGRTERLEPHAKRSYGSGDEGQIAGGLAGDAHAGLVDLAHFFRKSERRQALAIGPKRIGFNDLRTGANVILVYIADQGRQRQVELVVAAIQENALGIERRSHGPVGHQNAFVKRLLEFGGARLRSGNGHKLVRGAFSYNSACVNGRRNRNTCGETVSGVIANRKAHSPSPFGRTR